MTDVIARFWEKVDKSGDCWVWTASRTHLGYGYFKFRDRIDKAHRVAWILANGDIPFGMLVCHTCDNPPCVRPSHLVLGTPATNMADKMAKGRHRWTHKVTEDQVRLIRRLAAKGVSGPAIAKQIGVTYWTVTDIVRRRTWKNVA